MSKKIIDLDKMTIAEFERDHVDKIAHMKDLEYLKMLPDECIDLCVTSPPYNLRNTNIDGDKATKLSQKDKPSDHWKTGTLLFEGYDNYEDNMPHNKYVAWQRELISEVMRVLKPTGALFYNHKWRVLKGKLQTREDIVSGFPVRQIIIWDRATGPTYSQTFFMPVYEVVYLICKEEFRLVEKGPAYSDIWRIGFERDNDHPAPFPMEFVEKCVTSCIEKGSNKIILDPYMGSGTTAAFAKIHGCRYAGCDMSEKYIKDAYVRIKNNLINPELRKDEHGKNFKFFQDKKTELKVKKVTDMFK